MTNEQHPVLAADSGDSRSESRASGSGLASTVVLLPAPLTIVGGRYEIGELIAQRGPVERFRGRDLENGRTSPMPVVIVREALPPNPAPNAASGEIPDRPAPENPNELALSPASITLVDECPLWPHLAWERLLLARTTHLSLPRVLDTFPEDGFDYLIVEAPEGRSFWDAWDELPICWPRRCRWLIQIAEALDHLHDLGATIEGIRPEIVCISPTEQAVITDLADLLPLALPPGAPLRNSVYSAPELVENHDQNGGRAALYSFGAMVHALLLGRELTELDFAVPGVPRPYLERAPDSHPLLGRLLSRTFTHDVIDRFPSRDRAEADPAGFQELIDLLRSCSRSLDTVRLELAAWTNAGVVRSANEDAVAVLHSAEARLDDSDDLALLMLADGMGGMAAGEVAAALAVEAMRAFFVKSPLVAELLAGSAAGTAPESGLNGPLSDLGSCRQCVLDALHEANRVVYEAARQNSKQTGMGCTAIAVMINGKQVEIGHVGDSRCYHLRQGKIKQITHDQTLVSHLVALGQLTEAEAAGHPQRSELQQAIGGRKDVYPDTNSLALETGDCLLVCSDGLTNQLENKAIAEIMQSAASAEKAARRLVNRAILDGAVDNVSVIVVRAC
jgi:PPM family protein phosphatase